MSAPFNPTGPLNPPDLTALLTGWKNNIFATLNCHQPGTISSFNAAKQTAEVNVTFQRVVYNKPQDGPALQTAPQIYTIPLLVDVPVMILSGGNACLTMPIVAGDPCLLCFSDRDIDTWFSTNTSAPPPSSRMHNLSDAFAIVGFRNLANPVADYSAAAAELRNGEIKVSVEPTLVNVHTASADLIVHENGSASFENGTLSLQVSSAGKVTLDTDADVELTLGSGKYKLANTSANLRTVMDALMTALAAWTNTGGSVPNATTLANLAAVKISLDNLLKS